MSTIQKKNTPHNADHKNKWGSDTTDFNDAYNSCIGYVSGNGWALIKKAVEENFESFNKVKSIELGCGLGKVSLLFGIHGAETTLMDYSDKQLESAQKVHTAMNLNPKIFNGNILDLPEELVGKFDVSMSFGTAEHFWDEERQNIFNSHFNVLRPGGIGIIWVPNAFCPWYVVGRKIRQVFRRPGVEIEETPFTKKEICSRCSTAGFEHLTIKAVGRFTEEFNNFIFNIPRFLGIEKQLKLPDNIEYARSVISGLSRSAAYKNSIINEQFSYPLMMIGKKSLSVD